jgi:hypothetical protein
VGDPTLRTPAQRSWGWRVVVALDWRSAGDEIGFKRIRNKSGSRPHLPAGVGWSAESQRTTTPPAGQLRPRGLLPSRPIFQLRLTEAPRARVVTTSGVLPKSAAGATTRSPFALTVESVNRSEERSSRIGYSEWLVMVMMRWIPWAGEPWAGRSNLKVSGQSVNRAAIGTGPRSPLLLDERRRFEKPGPAAVPAGVCFSREHVESVSERLRQLRSGAAAGVCVGRSQGLLQGRDGLFCPQSQPKQPRRRSSDRTRSSAGVHLPGCAHTL